MENLISIFVYEETVLNIGGIEVGVKGNSIIFSFFNDNEFISNLHFVNLSQEVIKSSLINNFDILKSEIESNDARIFCSGNVLFILELSKLNFDIILQILDSSIESYVGFVIKYTYSANKPMLSYIFQRYMSKWDRIFYYIEQSLPLGFNAKEYADNLNMSAKQLSRLFKLNVGYSPSKWMENRRAALPYT